MEWIKVSDRLPEKGKEVLIYYVDTIVQAYQIDGYWKASVDVTDSMNDGFVQDRRICEIDNRHNLVTHWMPLPEPPKHSSL